MTEEPFLPWDVGIFDQIHQVNTNLEWTDFPKQKTWLEVFGKVKTGGFQK